LVTYQWRVKFQLSRGCSVNATPQNVNKKPHFNNPGPRIWTCISTFEHPPPTAARRVGCIAATAQSNLFHINCSLSFFLYRRLYNTTSSFASSPPPCRASSPICFLRLWETSTTTSSPYLPRLFTLVPARMKTDPTLQPGTTSSHPSRHRKEAQARIETPQVQMICQLPSRMP